MSCFCCQTDNNRPRQHHGYCVYSSPPPLPIHTAESLDHLGGLLNNRAAAAAARPSSRASVSPHRQQRDLFMRRSSGRDGMEIGALGTHHLRLSNGGSSSTNSSSSSLGSGAGAGAGAGGGGGGGHHHSHGGREVNVAVLGSKGVGKSALIVRYLTRRFIGDYDPEMEAIFTHSATVDNKQLVMHIMDTAWHRGSQEPREDAMWWADGFLLVFSVTDAASWAYLQDLVTRLRALREDDRLPVAIAANKCDLVHLQRVSSGDCSAWAAEHGCEYREVSVREDPASVEEVLVCLCRQVRAVQHKKREKLSWIMQRPAVAAKLQIRQSLRNFAEKTWRSRTSTL